MLDFFFFFENGICPFSVLLFRNFSNPRKTITMQLRLWHQIKPYKQQGRWVQESKKLFEEMRMEAQGTHGSVTKPTYTVALFSLPYFSCVHHVVIVFTACVVIGLNVFSCWDVNWIEHQRQLVVPLLYCPKQRTKLVMKLHILNLSHFPSRPTSKNVFLGFEKWCKRWVAVVLDLKSVQGSNDFLFGC